MITLPLIDQTRTAPALQARRLTEDNLLADMSGFSAWLASQCCGCTPAQTAIKRVPTSATGQLMLVEAMTVPQLVAAMLYPSSGLSYFAVSALKDRYLKQMAGRDVGAANGLNFALSYVEVFNADLNGAVVAGIDSDGDLTEVWAGGVNVGPFLADIVCQQIELDAHAALKAEAEAA